MGEIEQPRPTSVIRPIRAAMTKDIEKMSEVTIKKNEEQRNMW